MAKPDAKIHLTRRQAENSRAAIKTTNIITRMQQFALAEPDENGDLYYTYENGKKRHVSPMTREHPLEVSITDGSPRVKRGASISSIRTFTFFKNASSAAGSIFSKSTPHTNASLFLCSSWNFESSGISYTHGGHQVAQKFNTTH